MKTNRSQRFLPPFLFLFFAYFINAQTITKTPLCGGSPCGSNYTTVELSITGITDTNLVGGEGFRFYWYFGDGHYLNETDTLSSPLSSSTEFKKTHTFIGNGTYDDVFLEVTRIYTENRPPKRFYFADPNTTGDEITIQCSSSCSYQSIASPEAPLKMKMNRNPVPGHKISFIITYDAISCGSSANNLLKFEDLSNALDSISTFPVAINPGSNPLMWKPAPGSNPGRVFVSATLKPESQIPIGTLLDFKSNLTLKVKDSDPPCEEWDSNLMNQKTVHSHDPNDLDSPSSYLLCEKETDSIRYTIRFQNIGEGPAKRIEIRDIIPEVFQLNDNSINTIYPTNDTSKLTYTIHGHEVRWIIEKSYHKNRDTTGLKGTNQYGYGVDFFEPATIDSLVFKIPFKPTFNPVPCDAIVNRAEIIFDCNPSIYTNPHILRFGCLDTLPSPVPLPSTNAVLDTCLYCGEKNIAFYGPLTFTGSDTMTYNELIGILPNPPVYSTPPGITSHYRWYPATGIVSSSTDQNPSFLPSRSTEYFRVRSFWGPDTCGKEITKIPIIVPCSLALQTEVECNADQDTITLTATATGAFSSPSNLAWVGCPDNTSTTYTQTFVQPFPDFVEITVSDTETGCVDTIRITLACKRTNPVHEALLYIAIGIIAVLALFRIFTQRTTTPNENP